LLIEVSKAAKPVGFTFGTALAQINLLELPVGDVA
jgi:hypothetical protein